MTINLTIKLCISTVFVLLLLISCGTVTPADFWTRYEKDLCLKDISDQGPYGGHRALYWKTDKKNTFRFSLLNAFAIQNGWSLVDSFTFPLNTLKKWSRNSFPFTYTDFSDTKMNISEFPRWINANIKLYRFKTGWVAVEPGNARETSNNGYIMISQDGTELSVYHLWGE